MCKTYFFRFQLNEAGERSEDEESVHSLPNLEPVSPLPTTRSTPSPVTSGATSYTPSTIISAATRKTKPASKKTKIDQLLCNFLERPRPEEVLNRQVYNVNTIGGKCTFYFTCLNVLHYFILQCFTISFIYFLSKAALKQLLIR